MNWRKTHAKINRPKASGMHNFIFRLDRNSAQNYIPVDRYLLLEIGCGMEYTAIEAYG
jgi:hypothetical protein